MVKSVYNYSPEATIGPPSKDIPKPPELPKYEPNSEPSYWSWEKFLHNGMTSDKNAKDYPPIGDIPEDPNKPDWRGVVRNNVIELPMPEKVKYGQPIDPNYFFFDTPDYADPFKKLWWSAKFFARTGIVISCTFGIMEAKQWNWANNKYLLARYFKPWFAGGMITSMAMITIANLRGKKDDYWNYAAAGFVTACYRGRNNHIIFARNAVIWPIAAVTTKYTAETNGIMWPKVNPRSTNWSLSGMSTEGGWRTGDLRFGITGVPDGVGKGRDVRDISKY